MSSLKLFFGVNVVLVADSAQGVPGSRAAPQGDSYNAVGNKHHQQRQQINQHDHGNVVRQLVLGSNIIWPDYDAFLGSIVHKDLSIEALGEGQPESHQPDDPNDDPGAPSRQPGLEGVDYGHVPLRSHGRHGVNAHKHGGDGEPVLEPAELLPEVPDVVAGVDEVEDGVEGRHQQVREGQVHDEVIGGRPHPPVRQDDPDDGDVANDGGDNDEGVGDGPQGDSPSWLAELGGCCPVAAIPQGLGLRNVACVQIIKRAHGFSLLVSVKGTLLVSHFLAAGAGGEDFLAFHPGLLKRHRDELSPVLLCCFPSDAVQLQEGMSDAKGLLLLPWHFNLHLKSKNQRTLSPPFSSKKRKKKTHNGKEGVFQASDNDVFL